MNESERITHGYLPCPKCGKLKMYAFRLDGEPLAEPQSCLDCMSHQDRAALDKQVASVLHRYKRDSTIRLCARASLGALQAFIKATVHKEKKQC